MESNFCREFSQRRILFSDEYNRKRTLPTRNPDAIWRLRPRGVCAKMHIDQRHSGWRGINTRWNPASIV